jgi:hypothetical protein
MPTYTLVQYDTEDRGPPEYKHQPLARVLGSSIFLAIPNLGTNDTRLISKKNLKETKYCLVFKIFHIRTGLAYCIE